jgi:membrane carboxypeptidase/penicillin-binding protein
MRLAHHEPPITITRVMAATGHTDRRVRATSAVYSCRSIRYPIRVKQAFISAEDKNFLFPSRHNATLTGILRAGIAGRP